MIILSNNKEVDYHEFVRITQYYISFLDIDPVVNVGNDFIEVDFYDPSKEDLDLIFRLSRYELHNIFYDFLRGIFYESIDYEDEIDLTNFEILSNNHVNSFIKVMDIKDAIIQRYCLSNSPSDLNDYSAAIAELGITNIDLNKEWMAVVYYEENDVDIYPYPDRRTELRELIEEFPFLNEENIMLDNHIGYYLITNDFTKNELFHAKISSITKYKFYTSYELEIG